MSGDFSQHGMPDFLPTGPPIAFSFASIVASFGLVRQAQIGAKYV